MGEDDMTDQQSEVATLPERVEMPAEIVAEALARQVFNRLTADGAFGQFAGRFEAGIQDALRAHIGDEACAIFERGNDVECERILAEARDMLEAIVQGVLLGAFPVLLEHVEKRKREAGQ